jgi:hypothetical protein
VDKQNITFGKMESVAVTIRRMALWGQVQHGEHTLHMVELQQNI